jgi:hypothetical protein
MKRFFFILFVALALPLTASAQTIDLQVSGVESPHRILLFFKNLGNRYRRRKAALSCAITARC